MLEWDHIATVRLQVARVGPHSNSETARVDHIATLRLQVARVGPHSNSETAGC